MLPPAAAGLFFVHDGYQGHFSWQMVWDQIRHCAEAAPVHWADGVLLEVIKENDRGFLQVSRLAILPTPWLHPKPAKFLGKSLPVALEVSRFSCAQ